MIAWLTDTLIYTGITIALVLVLRRPVARHFGPQMAYALWALPLLRFVMPPIVLPAEFGPQPAAIAAAPIRFEVPAEAVASDRIGTAVSAGVPKPAVSAPDVSPYHLGEYLDESALLLWLAGAAAFLAWRAWTYVQMRDELLMDARPVGEAGKVRLVETPAVAAPVAFGVGDKVVALPMQFMALEDRAARDLAIEHELAHHRGWDLLANILAQPILALHWFNPLAWMGWRAMRRDQEAACDARVVARRAPEERAAYGEVIASFAAGPRLALAAPMACPILGEKSIIHRLRSLTMSDVSPRRRWAGRVLLAGAALALPLTASVSYAEAPEPAAPLAPPAPPAAPAPPVAPPPPDALEAPLPPAAPEAPPAMHVVLFSAEEASEAAGEPREEALAVSRHAARAQAAADRAKRKAEAAAKKARSHAEEAAAARTQYTRSFAFASSSDKPMSGKEMEKRLKLLHSIEGNEFFAMFGEDGPEFDIEFDFSAIENADFTMPEISIDCDGEAKSFSADDDEAIDRHVMFCTTRVMANAREALKRARDAVKHDRSLEREIRNEVLRSLDEQIEMMTKQG